jgi:pimeloyl-ACP methyl ester carboxylesterase
MVVLVHGSMDRSAAFARLVGHLRDLHTVRYDRRGYGRSIGLGAPDLAGHVDDLLAIIADRPAVAVGHSIGGVIALMAAQRAPHIVRAVGAYEAPMPWLDWWSRRSAGAVASERPDPADGAEAFMRRMIGDDRWEALPAGTRADRRAEGVALIAELASARAGPAYDIDAITVPVRVARGTAAKDHHQKATESLAAAVGCEPFLIDGAQHGGHVSHHGEFAAFVRTVVDAARA